MSATFWACASFLIVFLFFMGILALSLCRIAASSDKILEERLRMIMEEKHE